MTQTSIGQPLTVTPDRPCAAAWPPRPGEPRPARRSKFKFNVESTQLKLIRPWHWLARALIHWHHRVMMIMTRCQSDDSDRGAGGLGPGS